MFGGPLTHPKKPAPHVKNIPIKNDYHMVGYDGIFGHVSKSCFSLLFKIIVL